jgi:hypothetical protein
MRIRWTLVAMAIPSLVAIVALYLAVENVARAGPGNGVIILAPEVPSVVSYQGLITDPDTGDPVTDGIYNMRFGIYNAAVVGAQMWEEPLTPAVIPVQVSGGVFTVLLGSIIPLSPGVLIGGDAYLEVEVNGETLAPRQMMASVPYAMVAETLLGNTLADLDNRYVRNNGLLPDPTYDSGFQAYAKGESKTLDHDIKGNPDDYVVDMQCKYSGDGFAHNFHVGGDFDGADGRGATWDDLQSNTIFVLRWGDDLWCDQIRVRIWETDSGPLALISEP